MQSAHRLGRETLSLGLETLDLARIHKAAMTALVPQSDSPADRDRKVERAGIFFSEAIIPIEKTHRASMVSAARLNRKTQALARRTAQLAAANHHLRQGIVRRKAAEEALVVREQHYATLLKESHQLQKHLQHLTHQILSAQEDERKKISNDLRNEIAQTLLGINIRLLTLRKGATTRNKSLAKEIASTQGVVKKSVKTINRFAGEFVIQHES